MNRSSFSESFAAFVNYVKLFVFLAAVGAVGYYFYSHRQKSRPASTESVAQEAGVETGSAAPVPQKPIKPSFVLQPLMESNLGSLLGEIDGSKLALEPAFTAFEQKVDQEKVRPGPQQSAWNAASAVCREIRRLSTERNAMADSLQKLLQPVKSVSVVPVSKMEEIEKAKKSEFFVKSANIRWKTSGIEREKKVRSLYAQLLAAEALSADVWEQKAKQ